MKLLIVDDDAVIADFVRQSLKEDGYAVDIARDRAEGRMLAMVYDYDGLVLDLVLPDGTGIELLRELRERGNAVPVLMLTTRDARDDVIRGLDAGADDYLAKPFDVGELRARIRALVRRGGAKRSEQVAFGELTLDRLTHTVSCHGHRLKLTPKEYTLLEYFILHPERVISRTELLEKVWDLHFDPGSNVVDTHVARLRGKLERGRVAEAKIATVRGSGFMLTLGQEE